MIRLRVYNLKPVSLFVVLEETLATAHLGSLFVGHWCCGDIDLP
jgi:hypothetical protein